jgi:rhodanese-related sulfurtransferase
MPKTQQDFLEEARREIPEVSVEEVEARRKRGDDFVLLDVREKDEVRAGYIEGAVTIPRGFLEFQAAGHIPDTDKDVVVYCAGGARSLLAAKVLRSMGYDRVSSMAGGITRWRDAGYAVMRDRQLSAEQLERYSRHFLLSQIGEKGQGKLLDWAHPRASIWPRLALARWALWMRTSSTSRTCNAKCYTVLTALACRRLNRPNRRSMRLILTCRCASITSA